MCFGQNTELDGFLI